MWHEHLSGSASISLQAKREFLGLIRRKAIWGKKSLELVSISSLLTEVALKEQDKPKAQAQTPRPRQGVGLSRARGRDRSASVYLKESWRWIHRLEIQPAPATAAVWL